MLNQALYNSNALIQYTACFDGSHGNGFMAILKLEGEEGWGGGGGGGGQFNHITIY